MKLSMGEASPWVLLARFYWVIVDVDLCNCTTNHSTSSSFVMLAICAYYIMLIGSDKKWLTTLEHYLQNGLGYPKYFLGIESVYNKGVFFYQIKYA